MEKQSSHHQLLSVSKSYHDTTELLSKHLWKFFGVVFIPSVLTYIAIAALVATVFYSITSLADIRDFFTFTNAFSLFAFFFVVLIVFIQIVGFIAMTHMTVHHGKSTVLDSFVESFNYFWRFVTLGIFITLIMAAGLVAGYLVVLFIGIIIGFLSLNLLTPAFDWLTLIPLVTSSIATTFFAFAGFSIVDKNYTTKQALAYSKQLVSGVFWPVGFRLLLLYGVLSVITYAFQFIPTIGGFLSLILITPFAIAYLFVLYSDLKNPQNT